MTKKTRRIASLILASAFLCGVGPSDCVSRNTVVACEAACVEHGGFEWIIPGHKVEWDCVCKDYEFIDLEGVQRED